MPDHLDEALRQMIAPFAGIIGSAQAVLEIGTGTGALIPHLNHCAPGVKVISIDLAHGMLRQARQRCPTGWLAEADVRYLPFASGARSPFDVIVCHNSFPHFADRQRALSEMQRVLRPGGQLWISWQPRADESGWTSARSSSLLKSIRTRQTFPPMIHLTSPPCWP